MQAVPTPSSRAVPCQVLVVDDDELMREHLAGVIQTAGYAVSTAGGSAEALRLLASTDCRVVITDWEMPGMDGVALCRSIRERADEEYVFLMMLTVRAAQADIVAGLDAGADDYIVKGAAPQELVARIDRGRRILDYLDSRLKPKSLAQSEGAQSTRDTAENLEHEYTRCRRANLPFTLLLCEVEEFERHEAQFGVDVAARLMQALTSEISKTLLSGDGVRPAGPGRVMVISAETGLEGASSIATRVRDAALETARRGSALLPLTLRIGAAVSEPDESARTARLDAIVESAWRSLRKARVDTRGTVVARVDESAA